MPRHPRIPGAAPAVAAVADPATDDLSAFEEGGELPAVDPVQIELASLRAKVTRLERRGHAEPVKPVKQEPEFSSQEEAAKEAAKQVARGQRPRALLTPEGWYVHPESARVPGSLGNVKPS